MPESYPVVAPGFEWRVTPTGSMLVCLALERIARHAFTGRGRQGTESDSPDYEAVGALLGLPARDVARVRQVHGRQVLVLSGTVQHDTHDADAMVSTDESQAVSVRVADCVPILLADRRRRAVAAVHAGWRGTAAGVVVAVVDVMAEMGVPADEIVAAIGPSIGACCYQVDAVVRDQFGASQPGSAEWFTEDGPGRWKLDLWRANRDQLASRGVPISSIDVASACTADDPSRWHSFRRDGSRAGRMVAAIRLTSDAGPQPAT